MASDEPPLEPRAMKRKEADAFYETIEARVRPLGTFQALMAVVMSADARSIALTVPHIALAAVAVSASSATAQLAAVGGIGTLGVLGIVLTRRRR